jgi:hypothetical protein
MANEIPASDVQNNEGKGVLRNRFPKGFNQKREGTQGFSEK